MNELERLKGYKYLRNFHPSKPTLSRTVPTTRFMSKVCVIFGDYENARTSVILNVSPRTDDSILEVYTCDVYGPNYTLHGYNEFHLVDITYDTSGFARDELMRARSSSRREEEGLFGHGVKFTFGTVSEDRSQHLFIRMVGSETNRDQMLHFTVKYYQG